MIGDSSKESDSNIFKSEDVLLNPDHDPDKNFFDKNLFLQATNAQYISVEEFSQQNVIAPDNKSFSILHVNIRSMSKNFENFKLNVV